LMLHRTRHLFIRQQTAVINAIRSHLAEFGIVASVGRHGVEHLLNIAADLSDERLPDVMSPGHTMPDCGGPPPPVKRRMRLPVPVILKGVRAASHTNSNQEQRLSLHQGSEASSQESTS